MRRMREFTSSPKNLVGMAVSTMHARLLENVELVEQLVTLGWHVVVVNQHTTPEGKLDRGAEGMNHSHVQVVNSERLGLSHSRNQAMEELQKQSVRWAVLCDDDVTLDLDACKALAAWLGGDAPTSSWHDVGAVTTRLMKSRSTPWRTYQDTQAHILGTSTASLRRIQFVNSMELVVHVHALAEWNVGFNPQFGLGAPPVNGGEEVLLMHDILQAGGAVVPTPFEVRLHPDESSGQVLNAQAAFTQGAVHRKVFGHPVWWGLVAVFAWKRLKSGNVSRISDYLRGGAWASRHD